MFTWKVDIFADWLLNISCKKLLISFVNFVTFAIFVFFSIYVFFVSFVFFVISVKNPTKKQFLKNEKQFQTNQKNNAKTIPDAPNVELVLGKSISAESIYEGGDAYFDCKWVQYSKCLQYFEYIEYFNILNVPNILNISIFYIFKKNQNPKS